MSFQRKPLGYLTPTEKAIAELLAEGFTTGEIVQLGCSFYNMIQTTRAKLAVRAICDAEVWHCGKPTTLKKAHNVNATVLG